MAHPSRKRHADRPGREPTGGRYGYDPEPQESRHGEVSHRKIARLRSRLRGQVRGLVQGPDIFKMKRGSHGYASP